MSCRQILILCIVCCLSSTVAYAKSKQELVAEIERIVHSVDSKASVGIHVKSMKYGDTLYARNEQALFTPASVLKILTAEAALIYLGPQYTFPTTLLIDSANRNNGVINGNLYVVYSGDPSLTIDDLSDMMDMLKAQQIRAIRGAVYIDNTAYDQANFGPGWLWSDRRYGYDAPINASIINHNCVSFKVLPAKVPGHIASVIGNPQFYYSSLKNSVITRQAHAHACYLKVDTHSGTDVSLSGCIPKGKFAWSTSIVVPDVMEFNKTLMQGFFHHSGIQVYGGVRVGAAPAKVMPIAVHRSKPLFVLVSTMLKKSDNIIAGSLFKKLGEFYTRQPGSWKNGRYAVSQILAQKASVNTAQSKILDGSGLSPDNEIKPAQLMQVLEFAFHDEATRRQFIAALPIAGVDGTLKHRMYNVARKVRAKTGSISGVVALAGYAMTKDKEPLAFVIMVNGPKRNTWKYREMENKIATALVNYSRA